MMRRILFIGVSLLLGVFILLGVQKQAEAPATPAVVDAISHDAPRNASTIFIGDTVISIELALTDDERTLGLGGREVLPQNAGMFFVFPRADIHSIWMKNMRFPIDIVWLAPSSFSAEKLRGLASGGQDAKCVSGEEYQCLVVVDLKEHVAPESYPEVFYPKAKALYVLELNAGAAQKSGIHMGSVLVFKRP